MSSTERCPSGLRCGSRKSVRGNTLRGFESHPLRFFKYNMKTKLIDNNSNELIIFLSGWVYFNVQFGFLTINCCLGILAQ